MEALFDREEEMSQQGELEGLIMIYTPSVKHSFFFPRWHASQNAVHIIMNFISWSVWQMAELLKRARKRSTLKPLQVKPKQLRIRPF